MKKSGLIAVLTLALFFGMVTYVWFVGGYPTYAQQGFSIEQLKGPSLLITMVSLIFLLKNDIKQALKKGLFED